MLRCRTGIVCGLVAAALVFAPAALAISRDQANRIALTTLKPQAEPGRVVLFGLSAPLPATAAVFEGGTPTLTKGPTTVTVKRLGGRAWLFWEDLAYDARFQHPSRLLLIDDKTGAVLARKDLRWYPLVDGRPPAFLGTGYHNGSFQVFSSVAGAPRVAARLKPRVARAGALSFPPDAFKDDCIVMIGLRKDPQFSQDFAGMTAAAGRYGIRAFTVNSASRNADADGKDLVRAVDQLTKAPHNCKDVLIYIDGHGYRTGPTGVNVGWKWTSAGTTARGRTKWKGTPANVTSDDLSDILKAHPQTTFKLVIDACFSGRFVLDLPKADHPNMLVLDTAARADEYSYSYVDKVKKPDGTVVNNNTNNPGNSDRNGNGRGEFTNGFLAGMEAFANSPAEVDQAEAKGGSLFARMVERAFTLGLSDDFAASQGLMTPLISSNLPSGPHHCTVSKPFPVYAVPEGYTQSFNDVFPHVPSRATNIGAPSFVDTATGQPPGPHPFPGESWSVTVPGFQPDGKYDVRVTVTGQPYGQPNQYSVTWRVTVPFDLEGPCP